ncbi:MAG TPA: hypothetical protein VMZ91_15815 [Candidatus Paceibacterota bacterium]|nr:hypothetical protein [Candidatus Paceibacterota bacterium]
MPNTIHGVKNEVIVDESLERVCPGQFNFSSNREFEYDKKQRRYRTDRVVFNNVKDPWHNECVAVSVKTQKTQGTVNQKILSEIFVLCDVVKENKQKVIHGIVVFDGKDLCKEKSRDLLKYYSKKVYGASFYPEEGLGKEVTLMFKNNLDKFVKERMHNLWNKR